MNNDMNGNPRERNERANKGFAAPGSYERHKARVRATRNVGGVVLWCVAAVLVALAIVMAVFGIRILMNKKEPLPSRLTVVYSEEVSVKYDREELYIGDTLYIDFDAVASVLGFTKSVSGNTVTYYAKGGDSIVFNVGEASVTVNGISSNAGGAPFLGKSNEFMAPAYVVNAYINDTVISVSEDNKRITVITVSDNVSFNPKKSETLGEMSKPSSFPADTKYDPYGTLPPDEVTVPVTTTPETTAPETTAEATTAPVTTEPAPYPTDAEILSIIAGYTYKIDATKYLPYMNPTDQKPFLILANRENPLGQSYAPDPQWKLPTEYTLGGKAISLDDNAYMALDAMIREMKADGVWDTTVCSGYRSYSYQYNLYHNTYYNQEKAKNPGLSDEEIYKIIDTYSARPGTSDHQTGLCVDFYELEETFENRAAFKWLEKNAYRFGFILRFPKGKTDITGYTYEPWHWRFVGQLSAYKIHHAGLTLEEFLASEQ